MRKTRTIYIGNVQVGGGANVSVQSMTNTPTYDVLKTLKQINSLYLSGCQIIRLAVPDKKSALALLEIVKESPIPVIADIHFNYKLALRSIDNGVHALRINPGNIGSKEKVKLIANYANSAGIPIRVGVNSGSLDADLIEKYKGPTPEALVASALRECSILEENGFKDIKVSLKSSNVLDTFKAYTLFAAQTNYPLHIGITEAGTKLDGTIKSSIGIGALLLSGIGDTIRVSLTAAPEEEAEVGVKILEAIGLRTAQIEIISCPTCGRTKINLIKLAENVKKEILKLKNIKRKLKIAVMGCVVNGPGEAGMVDYGIAGGENSGIIFKNGNTLKKVPEQDLLKEFIIMIKENESS